jgi:ribosomal protein S21
VSASGGGSQHRRGTDFSGRRPYPIWTSPARSVISHDQSQGSGRANVIFLPRVLRHPRHQPNQRNVILVQVLVRDNNVDQALRALKKKMQREGIFREMKMRDYYEKPSQKRAREKAEAVRRVRKLARKRAQREGLVAR